jgi:hypothetical protein
VHCQPASRPAPNLNRIKPANSGGGGVGGTTTQQQRNNNGNSKQVENVDHSGLHARAIKFATCLLSVRRAILFTVESNTLAAVLLVKALAEKLHLYWYYDIQTNGLLFAVR